MLKLSASRLIAARSAVRLCSFEQTPSQPSRFDCPWLNSLFVLRSLWTAWHEQRGQATSDALFHSETRSMPLGRLLFIDRYTEGLLPQRVLRCLTEFIVAKIFYCGSSNRLGTLRAVVQFSDLSGVLSQEISNYVGQAFPEPKQTTSSYVVIEIMPDEKEANWRPGFYLVENSPIQFEITLRAVCDGAKRRGPDVESVHSAK